MNLRVLMKNIFQKIDQVTENNMPQYKHQTKLTKVLSCLCP